MILEYNSLLLAAGVTACVCSLTFLVSFLSDRSSSVLALVTGTLLVLTLSIVTFILYTITEHPLAGAIACATLIVSLTFILIAAKQFRLERRLVAEATTLSAILVMAITTPYLIGYDGSAFIITNLIAAALLFLTAREYWICRKENIGIISSILALYLLLATSFAICAVMLIIETPFILNGPPDNWSEALNLAISIPAIAGIASLSIALNNHRIIRRHREDAQTDPLTGALNRRALFDRFGETGLPPRAAAVIFDLDHFKNINDTHGHAIGDRFLKIFIDTCRQSVRRSDIIVRLGGEEFAVILLDSTESTALVVAEIIRIGFAKRTIKTKGKLTSCTVSAGIYINTTSAPQRLSNALHNADSALYGAKHEGRNVVHLYKETQDTPDKKSGPIAGAA